MQHAPNILVQGLLIFQGIFFPEPSSRQHTSADSCEGRLRCLACRFHGSLDSFQIELSTLLGHVGSSLLHAPLALSEVVVHPG